MYIFLDFGNTLKIRDTSSDGHKVEGATWVQVYSVSDVISLMRDGLRKRATSSTAMNHLSSRSHCCLSVLVKGRNLSLGAIQTGILYMVDLAGSENPVKADTIGDKDRMKETVSINKSFGSFQGQGVLEALSKKHDHIPYVVFLNKTLF
ncbi:Kinesin-like protein KIN-14H [Cardamine amara subsp. amara]|uniref:Kinesin-like protein KIN-14H n=1 Tax=Cardamine amara subsp. amara TaxID=228776 RepID=A0ABD1B2C4_CARAN